MKDSAGYDGFSQLRQIRQITTDSSGYDGFSQLRRIQPMTTDSRRGQEFGEGRGHELQEGRGQSLKWGLGKNVDLIVTFSNSLADRFGRVQEFRRTPRKDPRTILQCLCHKHRTAITKLQTKKSSHHQLIRNRKIRPATTQGLKKSTCHHLETGFRKSLAKFLAMFRPLLAPFPHLLTPFAII